MSFYYVYVLYNNAWRERKNKNVKDCFLRFLDIRFAVNWYNYNFVLCMKMKRLVQIPNNYIECITRLCFVFLNPLFSILSSINNYNYTINGVNAHMRSKEPL